MSPDDTKSSLIRTRGGIKSRAANLTADSAMRTRRSLIRLKFISYKLITAHHLVSGLELSRLASKRDRGRGGKKAHFNFIGAQLANIFPIYVCSCRYRR